MPSSSSLSDDDLSSFHITMSPEEYFTTALSGMSLDGSHHRLTTCPPLCKCSMCAALHRSFSVRTDDTSVDSSSNTVLPEESPVLIVKKLFEGPGRLRREEVLKVSTEEEEGGSCRRRSDGPFRSRRRNSHSSRDKKQDFRNVSVKARKSKSLVERDEEIEQLERELKEAKRRDMGLIMTKIQLEIERDNLRLAIEEVESQERRRRIALQKAKLELIREDSTTPLGSNILVKKNTDGDSISQVEMPYFSEGKESI